MSTVVAVPHPRERLELCGGLVGGDHRDGTVGGRSGL